MIRGFTRHLKSAHHNPAIVKTAEQIGVSRFEGTGIYVLLVIRANDANDGGRFSSAAGEPLPVSSIAEQVGRTEEEEGRVRAFIERGLENGLFSRQGGFVSFLRSTPGSRNGAGHEC